ncbi:hypothetical protein HF319_19370, partial [Xanthomonas sp. Kuri4-1]
MSQWLFDLGNSRFKFAPLQGDRAGEVQAWAHGAEAMDAAALSRCRKSTASRTP